jgi:glycosyl transferase family 25
MSNTSTTNQKQYQLIKAVVINLDRSVHRLNWFMDNAKKVDLNVLKLSAVDAQSDSNKSLILSFKGEGSELSDGEIACILSHRLAWKILVDSTDSHLIIFEDDVHLSTNISQLLKNFQDISNCDLIKLETIFVPVSLSQKNNKSCGNLQIPLMLTRHYGSAGYIVSRECALRLLNLTEVCYQPVDSILFDEKSVLWKEFDVYQALPALCVQEFFYSKQLNVEVSFGSDIGQSRKPKRKKTIKTMFSSSRVRKFLRYLNCVKKGANILSYKKVVDYVP